MAIFPIAGRTKLLHSSLKFEKGPMNVQWICPNTTHGNPLQCHQSLSTSETGYPTAAMNTTATTASSPSLRLIFEHWRAIWPDIHQLSSATKTTATAQEIWATEVRKISTFTLFGPREKLVDSERGDGGFKTQPLSASGAFNHNAPLQATLFPDASPDRGGGPCRINR